MPNAKKKVQKPKFELSKMSMIVAMSAGMLLLVAGGLWLRSHVVEKQSLDELSDLSNHVQSLYAKLVDANNGNIVNSHFGNTCSESSVEIGNGRIVCWTGGTVVLKEDVGLEAAAAAIEVVANDSLIGSDAKAVVSDSQYYKGVSVDYKSSYADVVCSGSYGQNATTGRWSYSVACRKEVSNFLPGYTVEK